MCLTCINWTSSQFKSNLILSNRPSSLIPLLHCLVRSLLGIDLIISWSYACHQIPLDCHVMSFEPHHTALHRTPCHAIHIWVSPHNPEWQEVHPLYSVTSFIGIIIFVTLRACRIIIEIVIVIMTIRRRQRHRQRFGVNIY